MLILWAQYQKMALLDVLGELIHFKERNFPPKYQKILKINTYTIGRNVI